MSREQVLKLRDAVHDVSTFFPNYGLISILFTEEQRNLLSLKKSTKGRDMKAFDSADDMRNCK